MRVFLGGLMLMCRALPAHAQNADLKNLWQHVTSGDVVRVKEASGLETRGVFSKVTASGLSVLVDGQPVEIPATELREIRRRGDSSKGGLFLGLGIGAGGGAGLVYGWRETTDADCPNLIHSTVLATAAGAGIGALIDRAIPGWTVAFRDNGTSFAVGPVILPAPRGMTASIGVSINYGF